MGYFEIFDARNLYIILVALNGSCDEILLKTKVLPMTFRKISKNSINVYTNLPLLKGIIINETIPERVIIVAVIAGKLAFNPSFIAILPRTIFNRENVITFENNKDAIVPNT